MPSYSCTSLVCERRLLTILPYLLRKRWNPRWSCHDTPDLRSLQAEYANPDIPGDALDCTDCRLLCRHIEWFWCARFVGQRSHRLLIHLGYSSSSIASRFCRYVTLLKWELQIRVAEVYYRMHLYRKKSNIPWVSPSRLIRDRADNTLAAIWVSPLVSDTVMFLLTLNRSREFLKSSGVAPYVFRFTRWLLFLTIAGCV